MTDTPAPPPVGTSPRALSVLDLSVALGGMPILKDITFSISIGEVVAILGDNGSGKSTLLRAILGLVGHQRGSVDILGETGRFHHWERIGYVPQRASVSLHSTTVSEVVSSGTLANRALGWPRAKDRARVAWALDAVGMAAHAGELYLHLSGGQQQRVLIARGIVNRPALLLMDEPFAGVDMASQASITSAVTQLNATILVVLHETTALEDHLSRTLMISQGRLVPPVLAPTTRGTHETQPPPRTHLLTGMEPRWS